ncbi:MAG TPA: flavin reductase family protein [Aggregatilineales bacterium]|nr:flavin reductase family protein [Aggregatilineales bacterium]
MPLDPHALRLAMRNWVAGVTVVTTIYHGARAGMTVSSFTSVSLEPPMVLVCLNKETYTQQLVSESGRFAISMLAQDQAAISNRFAGLDPTVVTQEDRFTGLAMVKAETGCPLIAGAVAWLDCLVSAAHEAGTHTLFIGEVVYARSDPARQPLVYFNRKYQLMTPMETP